MLLFLFTGRENAIDIYVHGDERRTSCVGTSTDVSRYDGQYEHVFETTTGGMSIQAPQLDINTVAAGGGSRLFFRSGLFVVGPESAGAFPGPTCYGKGQSCLLCPVNLVYFVGQSCLLCPVNLVYFVGQSCSFSWSVLFTL